MSAQEAAQRISQLERMFGSFGRDLDDFLICKYEQEADYLLMSFAAAAYLRKNQIFRTITELAQQSTSCSLESFFEPLIRQISMHIKETTIHVQDTQEEIQQKLVMIRTIDRQSVIRSIQDNFDVPEIEMEALTNMVFNLRDYSGCLFGVSPMPAGATITFQIFDF